MSTRLRACVLVSIMVEAGRLAGEHTKNPAAVIEMDGPLELVLGISTG